MKKHKTIRKILVLADLHCGSTLGLMPPGFRTLEGNKIILNPIQEWLWMCWERAAVFIKDVVDGEPFAIVLNGDLIEGIHHGTKQVWSPEVADHAGAAIQILKPICDKASKIFTIKGTEIHTQNTETSISDALGGEMNHETGIRSFDRLTLDLNGIRHVFRHHIGTTVRRGLAGTQLSANLVEEQVEAVNNGEPIPRVVCVAHRHKFGWYRDDNGICVVSPPWQALTRFGHKVVSQARTKPGVYILDYANKNYSELPEIISRTFETPHPQGIQL